MFFYFVIMFIVALIFAGLGVAIYRGKTDLIHDYHQTKVTDKVAYGKAFGKAILVIAAAMLLSGIVALTDKLAVLAPGVLIAGLCIGVGAIVAVQKKYNKGFF